MAPQRTGVGVTKAPFVNLSVMGNFLFSKIIVQILSIMFIFARCHRSSAAVTPAKYELDIIQVTTVLIIQKKWENNGMEKIGLVTPTPGLYSTDATGQCILIFWDWDKMVVVLQTTFTNEFYWMKSFISNFAEICFWGSNFQQIFQYWFG